MPCKNPGLPVLYIHKESRTIVKLHLKFETLAYFKLKRKINFRTKRKLMKKQMKRRRKKMPKPARRKRRKRRKMMCRRTRKTQSLTVMMLRFRRTKLAALPQPMSQVDK